MKILISNKTFLHQIIVNYIFISFCSILFAFLGAIYAINLEDKFTSSAVLKISDEVKDDQPFGALGSLGAIAGVVQGSGGKSQLAMQTLRSKDFIKRIKDFPDVKENIIAAKAYDKKSKSIVYDLRKFNPQSKTWIRVPPKGRSIIPSEQELSDALLGKLKITENRQNGFILISFTHFSPVFASSFLSLIIAELNSYTREIDLIKSTNALEYLISELDQTNQMEVRRTLSTLIEKELKTQMLANISEDYLLEYIERPSISELRSEPNRVLLVILFSIIGALLAAIIVITKKSLSEK